MATRTQPVIMGSTAYDIDRYATFPDVYEDTGRPEPQINARTQAERQARAKRARRAQRQSISRFAVLGCIAVCVMLLLVVLSHMQLALVSSEIAQLDSELRHLESHALTLRTTHQEVFGNQVEQFARDTLGMVDPAHGQMRFIGATGGDIAEITQVAPNSNGGFFGYITALFATLQEYLPFRS